MPAEQGDALHAVRVALEAFGETLSPAHTEQLSRYHDLLVSSNPRYSLISPGDVHRVRERHFAESAQLLRWVPRGPVSILDIGSGGGLPGIVLKILRPAASVTLLERRRRKQVFLRFAVHRLALTGVAVAGSLSDLAKDPASERPLGFDRIVARAVAPFAELIPIATPLLRPDGLLIAPKGSHADEDLAAADTALRAAGLILSERFAESLTSTEGGLIHRATLVFRRRPPD